MQLIPKFLLRNQRARRVPGPHGPTCQDTPTVPIAGRRDDNLLSNTISSSGVVALEMSTHYRRREESLTHITKGLEDLGTRRGSKVIGMWLGWLGSARNRVTGWSGKWLVVT